MTDLSDRLEALPRVDSRAISSAQEFSEEEYLERAAALGFFVTALQVKWIRYNAAKLRECLDQTPEEYVARCLEVSHNPQMTHLGALEAYAGALLSSLGLAGLLEEVGDEV